MALGAVKPGRITIEKGFSPSPFMQVLVPLIAVILALAVCGLFLLFSGQDPFELIPKCFWSNRHFLWYDRDNP